MKLFRQETDLPCGYVLIETEVGCGASVAKEIMEKMNHDPRVVAVDHVTGPVDVIVQLYGEDLVTFGQHLVALIVETPFVERTKTCISATVGTTMGHISGLTVVRE